MRSKNKIVKVWDDAVESWVDFVRSGKDYYRDWLNNPATFELIGEVKDLIVLDLACGEGYNTRILAGKGAKVTGIDFSEKMLEKAKQQEEDEKLGICFHALDAANLRGLPDNYFDLATCFMSLQDIHNYGKAISEVSRVLRLGGRFVFSIPHPCFELISTGVERVNSARGYFGEIECHIQWKMERLLEPFETVSFHRTLTDYFGALNKSNLYVSRLVEPRPTKKALQKYPQLQEVSIKPQSLVIESVKIVVE